MDSLRTPGTARQRECGPGATRRCSTVTPLPIGVGERTILRSGLPDKSRLQARAYFQVQMYSFFFHSPPTVPN